MAIKYKSLVVQSIIGILFLFIWLQFVDLNEILKYAKDVNISLLPIVFSFYIFAYIVRSYRWKILLEFINNIPWREIFPIYFIGLFANYIIPLRIGEIVKSVLLKDKYNVQISKTFPIVVIDKIFDFFGYLLIVLVILFVGQISTSIFLDVILLSSILILLFLAFVFIYYIKKDTLLRLVKKIISIFVPDRYKNKSFDVVANLMDGVSLIRQSPTSILIAISLSIFAVIIDGTYVYLLFSAMRYPVTFYIAILGYSLIGLAYIIPSPPAQIGINEIFWFIVFVSGLGLLNNKIAAITIFAHISTGLIISFIGMFMLWYKYRRLIKI